ncbi:hypothetical protein ACHQM5_012099 [Ranunculus cassubicifolius]
MHPIQHKMREDVEFLKTVSREVLLNARDSDDFSALHHAVMKNQQDCVEEICERCPELVYHQAKSFLNMTALMVAATTGNLSMIPTILDASIKVDRDSNGGKKLLRMTDTDQRTALCWAVCSNQFEVTRFLLEADPDFEYGPDANGDTLLMAAERYTKSDYSDAGRILELVIEHQKQNEQRRAAADDDQTSILSEATNTSSKGYNVDAVKDLIGSSPEETHPIDYVAREDVKFLKTISKEVLLNARDSNDFSALHQAVMKNQQACVEEICEKCPELVYHQAKPFLNMTALMLAATTGHLGMIPTILDTSIKVDRDSNGGKKLLRMKDTDQRTALCWAVCSNQFEVTRFLLEADPDFEYGPDANGDTLLMAAERYAKSDYSDAGRILELVIEHQKRNEQRRAAADDDQTSILSEATNTSSKGYNVDAVKDLIGSNPEETHPIDYVAREDVKFLKTISKEVLLNARDSNDFSALHQAVMKNQQACVEEICEKCPELVYHQAKSFLNMTALMLAATTGHLGMIPTILDASIKVDRDSNGGKKLLRMTDTDQRSALCWAVCSNQFEVTRFLLEADPDFEYGPDANGDTLLMAAERYAQPSYPEGGRILELVIEHQKRHEQRRAALNEQTLTIKEATSTSSKGDGDGAEKGTIGSSPDEKRSIEHAVREDVKFIKTISKEVLLNARDSNDFSALHQAVMKNQQACVEEICEKCPELVYHQAKSFLNMTALMLAATTGHLGMIPTILDASIKVDRDSNGGKKLLRMEDTDKRSALWWAVCSNQFEVTKFLLEADLDFEYGPDVNGDTLLMAAERYAKSSYPDAGRILELLIEHQKRNEQRRAVLNEQTSKLKEATTALPKGDAIDAARLHDLPKEIAVKEDKKTELHKAASSGDIDAVRKIILTSPQQIDFVDYQKQNFVHLAAQFGPAEMMKFILDVADIPAHVLNAQDINGNTPLHIAALSGHLGTATSLLRDTRVLKETLNVQGQTILDAVLAYRQVTTEGMI